MKIDREWLTGFAKGIHSNIPICCVVYFCNVWVPLYSKEDKRKIDDDRRWALMENGESLRNKAQYVQCPECFNTDRVVKIHLCKPNGRDCFLDEFNRALYPQPKRTKKPKKTDK